MVPDRRQQWNVCRLKPLQDRRFKAPPHGIQLLAAEASQLTRDHVASTHHQIRLQTNELIQPLINGRDVAGRAIAAVDQGLDQLISLQPDLVVCAGDMVAGQMRGLSGQRLDAMWWGFETSVLQRLQAANIPLLPAIGNHDGSPAVSYTHLTLPTIPLV